MFSISLRTRTAAMTALIVMLIVAGCQNSSQETPALVTTAADSSISSTEPSIESTPLPINENSQNTAEPAQTEESSQAAINQPTPAPTLSDWRDAPIVPEVISDRIIQIYNDGQKQGRDPASFSVIGDCQSVNFVFMGPFGRGDLKPSNADSHLWNVINTFGASDSFNRVRITSRGGFTAASILNPIQADPQECKPGETPLTCEFRINNPAFVFITLETWLDPGTIDRYEIYLRDILDKVIARGAVPILLTKADSSELRGERHVINPVIVNVAYEYQVPVVNFWKAAQFIDNYGIDPEREGFHLSQEGYNLKNILALRALYQVWTTVEGIESVAGLSPTETSAQGADEHLLPEVILPECETGCIFFGLAQSKDGDVTNEGVFAYTLQTKELKKILNSGFDLQDVSNSNHLLLVNQENLLYEIDISDGSAKLITDSFYNKGKQTAYWNEDDSEIIFLDSSEPLETETGSAFTLFPNPFDDVLYFESGECLTKDFCQSEGVYRLENSESLTELDEVSMPVFSSDGSKVAFLNPKAATRENRFHIHYLIMEDTQLGRASRRILYLPDEQGYEIYPEVTAYGFNPDSNKIFILYNAYSEYYGHSMRLQTYLWNLENGILYDFGKLNGLSASLSPRFVWSPSGERILLFLTDFNEEGDYTISLFQTDLANGEKLNLIDSDILTGSDFIYITNLYWQ